MTQHYTVVIIGSGFGGQCAAINLLRNGITDFVILERRTFFGGTWRQNTYPGAAVDVQSLLYSFSFEPYNWSRMFAEQHELDNYTQHVVDKYQLNQYIRLNWNVDQLKWAEDEKHWQVQSSEQESVTAQFLINATGPLSTPVQPKFAGTQKFKGASFHTNDWDHSVDLTNKNVAIIGSGASAAQVVPAIVEQVKNLHIFQRTPHWFLPRWDWFFPRWQRFLLKFRPINALCRWLVYWLLELRIIAFKYSKAMLRWIGEKPAQRHLHTQIADPELRNKLTPDFTIGCKRIIVSSTFYPALMHPNAHLHDSSDGIKEITETGIQTQSGKDLDIDILVYATGYDASDGIISYPVIGEGGQCLSDTWQDFPRAYLGIASPAFPNLFLVTGPNTGIGHTSAIFVIESQMYYVMRCIKEVLTRNCHSVKVTEKAEQQYTTLIHQEMTKTVWHWGGCQSWYKSKSGRITAMFPGFSFVYRRLCKRFKASDHVFE